MDNSRIEALLANEPHKRYIKAIISRVVVKILDPISFAETEVVLSGDPKDKPKSCIVNLWTPMEAVYFERNNESVLKEGLVVEYGESITPPSSVNAITDAEIERVLGEKFFTLKNLLETFTSPAPVLRILSKAEELNKPVKTIDAIRGRLAELQAQEYKQ